MSIPGFLKKKRIWIGLVVVILLIFGFMFMQAQGRQRQAAMEAAVAEAPESPYAAVANGKADVEGGVIQVAARRGGVVREVYVNEGDVVTAGQILARQEEDSNFIAAQRLDQARDAIAMAEARLGSQRAAVQTAQARLNEAQYNLELTAIRAPMDGRIARRYAQPGAGASTLNVSNMFDLEPNTDRIVRAEIVEADIPNITIGQEVEITPEGDASQVYVGRVLRRAGLFGARRLQSDDPSQRADERVVEVVVSADEAPFLIGQRVLVKFMKPGETAGAEREVSVGVGPDQAMRTP